MKQVSILALLIACTLTLNAQSKKKKDQQAIKKMQGCYKVAFNFAETFNYSKDSTYTPSQVKHDKGLEWVELIEDQKDKIVMQHLLIVGQPNAQRIIKHWRQDWLFENTDFYMYNANNTWSFIKKNKEEVSGQWTQKVYQVDDSPRYEGSATWVHVDGKSFWENTTDAPLPRREYTKRQDYNVTVRTNKHILTPTGWLHDQDNNKVIRNTGVADVVLASEKGVNIYEKVEDSRCKAAQNWWVTHKNMWQLVRENWQTVFAKNKDLLLKENVDNKPLYRHLFSLDPNTKNKEIEQIITNFVK